MSVVRNTFISTGDRFMDIGVTDGVAITGNTMVVTARDGPIAGGDVRVFSSNNVGAGMAKDNRCYSGSVDTAPRQCSFVDHGR